jgi:hypothetical protein
MFESFLDAANFSENVFNQPQKDQLHRDPKNRINQESEDGMTPAQRVISHKRKDSKIQDPKKKSHSRQSKTLHENLLNKNRFL